MKKLYRTSESFEKYLMTKEKRFGEIKSIFLKNRKYFGKRVLDIGCGGGILGFVCEKYGYKYTGIDVNPDMIKAARAYAKAVNSGSSFILGDASKTNFNGKFDTVTFIGNGLGHVNARNFLKILKNTSKNLKNGSTFIVEYRDVVGLLFNKEWKDKMREMKGNRHFISLTIGCDTTTGDIKKVAIFSKNKKINFTHAIWSPFIMEALMSSLGFYLVKRKQNKPWKGWLEVYKRL